MTPEEEARLKAAVAEFGAFPMPVGPDPKPVDVEDQREQAEAWEGHVLGAWDCKFVMERSLDSAVLKLARMVKADVSELERLRARVAELETGRKADHETWQHDLRTARGEREASAAQVTELEGRLRDAAMARVWTNEDGKRFVFVEDIAPALLNLPDAGSSVKKSADRLTRLFAPTQALREDEPGAADEWCTGCNTDHDPAQCGYRPESGGE